MRKKYIHQGQQRFLLLSGSGEWSGQWRAQLLYPTHEVIDVCLGKEWRKGARAGLCHHCNALSTYGHDCHILCTQIITPVRNIEIVGTHKRSDNLHEDYLLYVPLNCKQDVDPQIDIVSLRSCSTTKYFYQPQSY